jgi:hypothetical protein
VFTVLFEDSAPLIGLVIALIGIALAEILEMPSSRPSTRTGSEMRGSRASAEPTLTRTLPLARHLHSVRSGACRDHAAHAIRSTAPKYSATPIGAGIDG